MYTAASKRRRRQPPFGLESLQDGKRDQTAAVQGYAQALKWSAELLTRWLWPTSIPTPHSATTHRTHLTKSIPLRVSCHILLGIITLCALLGPSEAAMVNFQNCLSPNIVDVATPPIPLQWVPLAVSAVFNVSAPSHNLKVTVYGNVTGQATQGELPPLNSSQWGNVTETLGKIVDVDPNSNLHSTLKAAFNVLTYTPYRAPPSSFCNNTLNTECPIAPVFPNSTGDL